MRDSMKLHIGLLFAFLLSPFIFPWWVSVAIAILFLFLVQPHIIEVLLGGIFLDALHGASVPGFYGIEFVFTILFLIFFALALFLKRYLVFY